MVVYFALTLNLTNLKNYLLIHLNHYNKTVQINLKSVSDKK